MTEVSRPPEYANTTFFIFCAMILFYDRSEKEKRPTSPLSTHYGATFYRLTRRLTRKPNENGPQARPVRLLVAIPLFFTAGRQVRANALEYLGHHADRF